MQLTIKIIYTFLFALSIQNIYAQAALENDLANLEINGKAKLIVKEQGVIAGVELAEIIFRKVNPSIEFNRLIQDGSYVGVGLSYLL